MIDESRLKGILELFGQVLPTRSLFFATKQTEQFITPGLLKSVYHEPTLGKAFAKFTVDYQVYVAAQTANKVAPVATKAVPPVTPVNPAPVVTKNVG